MWLSTRLVLAVYRIGVGFVASTQNSQFVIGEWLEVLSVKHPQYFLIWLSSDAVGDLLSR